MSGSENNYDAGSPAEEADPEIGLRDEEEPENEEEKAAGPEEGEDEDDAGYGEQNANENGEDGPQLEDRAIDDDEAEAIGEIDYYEKDDEYDDDNDEEAEYGEEKGKRRSKGSKRDKSTRSRKKKLRRNDGAEEAEEDPYAEEREEIEKKPKKGKRRSNFEEEVNETEVKKLIEDMDAAFEDDLICFKNKQPALNKLKLLPTVESYLKRAGYQKSFIEHPNNGLDCIAKWLMKLPNGAQPSLQLKKRLVDVVQQLPVSDEHLKSSEIGKMIYGMKNNPNEDPDLKKTLKDIVDKWTRLITDVASDYSTVTEDIRDRKRIDISLDDYRQKSMSSLRKSIPRMTMKRSGFDFVRKPQEVASTRTSNARYQANEECDKMIKDMKRRMKKELK